MPKPTKQASRKAATIEAPASTGMNATTNQTAAPVTPEATTTPNAAPQGAPAAPAKARPPRKASARKGAARGQKAARRSTTRTAVKKAAKPRQAAAREGSKKGLILALLHRKNGAPMAEIVQVTGWQTHSIRGFISGTVSKRLGFNVESTRSEAGRNYRITAK